MPLMLAFLLLLLLPNPGHMTHVPVWKLNSTLSLWHSCLLPMHDPGLPLKSSLLLKMCLLVEGTWKKVRKGTHSLGDVWHWHTLVKKNISGFWKKTRSEIEWVNILKELNCHGAVTSLAGWVRPEDNWTFNKREADSINHDKKMAGVLFHCYLIRKLCN